MGVEPPTFPGELDLFFCFVALPISFSYLAAMPSVAHLAPSTSSPNISTEIMLFHCHHSGVVPPVLLFFLPSHPRHSARGTKSLFDRHEKVQSNGFYRTLLTEAGAKAAALPARRATIAVFIFSYLIYYANNDEILGGCSRRPAGGGRRSSKTKMADRPRDFVSG